MRDPHVVALHYRLETGPQLAFRDPAPVDEEAGAFSLRLDNGELHVTMKHHFATVEDARLVVEPYLRSWEIATGLDNGPGAVRFRFDRPDVIDRAPLPPGSHRIVTVTGSLQVQCVSTVTLTTTRNLYPAPPRTFQASPDVVAMWERYEGYLAGKEPLSGMAFHCLTIVQQSVGGPQPRRQAALRYAIEYDVLSRLGYFASEVGDARTVRKRVPGQTLRPHTPAETAWMEAVVKRLIQRVGEWAADPNAKWPQITMTDFPSL